MRGDWFTTGDRYERREDGAYVFVGRTDEMLKVGGLWVSPIDMEHVIVDHPEVAGRRRRRRHARRRQPHRGLRRAPRRRAPRPTQLAEELRAMCKERLRRYEYPHVVHFVDELPRTPSGKVQRFKLRTLAAEAAERCIRRASAARAHPGRARHAAPVSHGIIEAEEGVHPAHD